MSNVGQLRPRSIPIKRFYVKVEAGVGRKAFRYAEKRQTSISIIIEEALVDYLKARASYFSDSPSS